VGFLNLCRRKRATKTLALIRTEEQQHRFHFPMPAHALIQLGIIVIGHPDFLSSPTHRLPIRRLSVD
jgi:hypothetical protein